MPAQFLLTKQIAAPVERVFDVFADLSKTSERISGIKKLEILTPGPVGKGTRFRETRIMFGKEATETMEITDFQPGRSYSVECNGCGAQYFTRFDFQPRDGGTFVEMFFKCTPISFFAKLMGLFAGMMMGTMKKVMDKDLEELKAAAERSN